MTTLTDLTPRQVLVVADAALEVAESAGVVVEQVIVHAVGHVTLLTDDGDAPALASAIGLISRRVHVYAPEASKSIEAFEGHWRGVALTVQHCIPTDVTS